MKANASPTTVKVNGSLPKTIGPYRITGHLGRGGMGEVLRGFDERLGRPVAAKRIRPDSGDPDQALRRFRREARSVARLSHPSIVQIYDWRESEGEQWLVMELIDGRALDQVVSEGPLAWGDALVIARDIASALAEAHEAGIVHRDLKTSNVMLTTGGRAKVLDFGLAKKMTREADEAAPVADPSITAEGRVLGTLHAMSPEQALGHEVDHRSDLFSLGVLLYEMLSGSPPFAGRNAPEILNALCNLAEVPLDARRADIPPPVAELVARLLEKDPDLRPQSAHEVVAEIDRLGAEPGPALGDAPALGGERMHAPAMSTDSAATTRFDLDPAPPHPQVDAPPVDALPDEEPKIGHRHGLLAALFLLVALALVLGRALPGPDAEVPDARAPSPGAREATPESSTSEKTASEKTAPEETGGLKKAELTRRGHRALDPSGGLADIDSAMRDFRQALAIDPRFAPALAGLAKAHRLDYVWRGRQPGRLQEALDLARRAVAIDEHLAVAQVTLGWIYLDLGRHGEASEAFRRAIELEPANAGALSGLGQVHEARGEYDLAEDYLLRAIEARPEITRLYSFLGRVYYLTGRYDEAVAAFERHLDEDPEAFVALSNLGATFYMQGRLAEAAGEFQKALQVQPDPALYSNVGTIYFTQGLYLQAAGAFEKAIENGRREDPLLWGNLGDAYRWAPGRVQESRDAYRRALDLLDATDSPEDVTSRSRRALFLAKAGECGRALAEADRLGEAFGSEHGSNDRATSGADGGAWYRLAVTREICGQRRDALRALDAALGARFSADEAARDPELAELRRDARYRRLLEQY